MPPRLEDGKFDDDHFLGSSKPTANDENLQKKTLIQSNINNYTSKAGQCDKSHGMNSSTSGVKSGIVVSLRRNRGNDCAKIMDQNISEQLKGILTKGGQKEEAVVNLLDIGGYSNKGLSRKLDFGTSNLRSWGDRVQNNMLSWLQNSKMTNL